MSTRARALVLAFVVLAAASLLACNSGDDSPTASPSASPSPSLSPSPSPSPPPTDPAAALRASADALGRLTSFSVHAVYDFDASGSTPAQHIEVKAAYADGTAAYYETTVSPQPSASPTDILTYLLLKPDFYLRTADDTWYVQSPWNQGIKPTELVDPTKIDPVDDYKRFVESTKDVSAVPDETINDSTYLRFDSATGASFVSIWLDEQTLLPFKVESKNSLPSDYAGGPDTNFTIATTFSDFDNPQPLPTPPAETRPIRDLQLPDALCVDTAFAGCAAAQDGLDSVAKPSCDGTGLRVSLVPYGQIDPKLVTDLVAYYAEEYGLPVSILTPQAVPTQLADNEREQVDASQLIANMLQAFPGTASDINAVLIGITPIDLYDSTSTFRYVFGVKNTAEDPKGIISTFRMDPRTYGDPDDPSLTFTRTRRLLSKYIGWLYYGLSTSSDPTSAMFDSILGVEDLDNMTQPLPVNGR